MDDFDRYGFSRQDLNVRAAHSLYRAGWMLTEINGVLQNGGIGPEGFQLIKQQAMTLAQLQYKFGPPPPVSSTGVSPAIDIKPVRSDVYRLPTMRVVNRGVEEAAAVLSHHGWHFSQIRSVLKASQTPLDNLGLALVYELQQQRQAPPLQTLDYSYQVATSQKLKKPAFSAHKVFFILFGVGIFIFMGISLIFYVL